MTRVVGNTGARWCKRGRAAPRRRAAGRPAAGARPCAGRSANGGGGSRWPHPDRLPPPRGQAVPKTPRNAADRDGSCVVCEAVTGSYAVGNANPQGQEDVGKVVRTLVLQSGGQPSIEALRRELLVVLVGQDESQSVGLRFWNLTEFHIQVKQQELADGIPTGLTAPCASNRILEALSPDEAFGGSCTAWP